MAIVARIRQDCSKCVVSLFFKNFNVHAGFSHSVVGIGIFWKQTKKIFFIFLDKKGHLVLQTA